MKRKHEKANGNGQGKNGRATTITNLACLVFVCIPAVRKSHTSGRNEEFVRELKKTLKDAMPPNNVSETHSECHKEISTRDHVAGLLQGWGRCAVFPRPVKKKKKKKKPKPTLGDTCER
jgi:hypothetical protein